MSPRLLLPALAVCTLCAVPAAFAQSPKNPAPPPPRAAAPPTVTPPDAAACTRLEGANAAPSTIEATGYRAAIRDGRVAVIMLELPGSRLSRTDFMPARRDGVSIRLTAFPVPQSSASRIVFNQALIEPDGTVLVETWFGATDRPGAAPLLNWYRLRCEAAPPSVVAPSVVAPSVVAPSVVAPPVPPGTKR